MNLQWYTSSTWPFLNDCCWVARPKRGDPLSASLRVQKVSWTSCMDSCCFFLHNSVLFFSWYVTFSDLKKNEWAWTWTSNIYVHQLHKQNWYPLDMYFLIWRWCSQQHTRKFENLKVPTRSSFGFRCVFYVYKTDWPPRSQSVIR